MRGAATNGHILKPTVSFDLTRTTLGVFRCEEMSFPQLTLIQPPVSLEHLKLFPEQHCIVVMNVGLKPGVMNVSSRAGR